ncbi:outer dense fiber protein 3-like [Cephus cinctus]|uniref:Outer dense fiber protein 3-like n=1 Tax=Cephus cinctus TaxID=211228 RepID=A0AAJ7C665_CEPCN|nr:outer dense fiber protein 3-like [Cephus cinctus]
MPPKKDNKQNVQEKKGNKKPAKPKKTPAVVCGFKSPGPKYKLATLVGYDGHDTTKYRNPAYTFRLRQTGVDVCDGPGPKYMVNMNRFGPYTSPGYSIGYAATTFGSFCGPGPKYMVRDHGPRAPAFSIKWRTNPRAGSGTPGPYNIPSTIGQGPAFSMGTRGATGVCETGPGPKYGLFDLCVVKPCPPKFSLGYRQTGNLACDGPGPKYMPKIPTCNENPGFTFGIKHSECAPPLVTECDEKC